MPDGSMHNQFTSNIALWETLRPVDKRFTKPITGKSYKGDSPNPTYIIMKLTEVLGPIGGRWGFNVVRETIREGVPHQIPVEIEEVMRDGPPDAPPRLMSRKQRFEIIREQHHQLEIEFWLVDKESGERRTFSAFGGTPMVYMAKSGKWIVDEDAAKKSLTDAYTKAASWLGACADIFLGIFDDKYTSQPHNAPGMDGPSAQQQQPKQDGGWEWDGNPDAPLRGEQQPQQGTQQNPRTPDTQRQNSAPSGW
ncbi:hypothetical protein [Mangrovicoccus algicola]|uniref:Uncharacterized protein n=1 Tax=Mangrovicoccus algicola TaxID=2771008 RepID=A0A8J6Z6K1_9RHOB|nr:hypothetical protein [Mangrovicoccus algicola]MBE3637370.1 hypothetical protein [Mangrovicoccus algicola]